MYEYIYVEGGGGGGRAKYTQFSKLRDEVMTREKGLQGEQVRTMHAAGKLLDKNLKGTVEFDFFIK